MIRALLYLQLHCGWNRLVRRLQRLKQPKYFAGFLVGGFYFYFYFFRHFFLQRKPASVPVTVWHPELLSGFELLGALAMLGLVLLKWILPQQRVALAFSEAEVSFLFAAPVSRRTLIHFKLLKSQAGILFTTLLMAFLSNRFGQTGNAWIHLAGWWIVLSTLNLHFLGASFARARLLTAGSMNWPRRLGLLALLLVLGSAILFWARQTIPAPTNSDLASWRSLWDYGRHALEVGPAPYLLFPFKVVVRPFLAPNAGAFFGALGSALALMILHYFWVVRSDVAFEEASVELARKRAELIAAARQGSLQASKRRRRHPPFALRPTGPPAVALLWKNLIGARSSLSLRTWIILALAFGVPAVMLSLSSRSTAAPPLLGMLVLMGLIWSVLAGPQLLRQDLRQDWRAADMLKGYPLAGWSVVLGELLAPGVILAAVQWVLLLTGAIVSSRSPDGANVPILARLSVAFGAATILPMLNLVSLLIPNAAVLLFPGWFQAGHDGSPGIEATGQRLIFAIGQLLVLLLALLPPAVVFGLVLFLGQLATNWVAAVPLASVAAAGVLAVEVAVGVGLLGKQFERCDLSKETQP